MRNELHIDIKYHDTKYNHKLQRIRMISNGDWIDLYTADWCAGRAGEFKYIPLGISMELPKGYEALVLPRSSTFKNYGIIMANSCGVIDNSYCGDNDIWMFPAYFTKDSVIPVDARICQFRVVQNQPLIIPVEVDYLGNDNRGGFGSTGV